MAWLAGSGSKCFLQTKVSGWVNGMVLRKEETKLIAVCTRGGKKKTISTQTQINTATGRMPFLLPNQQRQSTEGTTLHRDTNQHSYSQLKAVRSMKILILLDEPEQLI